jgi:malate dehydrogenase
MKKSVKKVVVTGGAGQIAYSLLFRLGAGELFGPDQPLELHLLELPQALEGLGGVVMELEDCAFPLLQSIKYGSDPKQIFEDAEFAFLVGSKPRGPGMERGELLKENGKIFIEQGKALDQVASKNVKVLVVGNPCNTNCLIAMHHAPSIPRTNFHAMTRLDQNRAVSQLAMKADVAVSDVSHMTIWGNHSSTQVPDFVNALIHQRPAADVIRNQEWLEGEFIKTVQSRGASIIAARGKSSAASAASAAIDAMKAILTPTPAGTWFSSAVCSDNNPYGIKEGLIFSFPCQSAGDGTYEIVKDVPWNEFLKARISVTEKELIEEREIIRGEL